MITTKDGTISTVTGLPKGVARQPKRPIFSKLRRIKINREALSVCMRTIEMEIKQRHPAAAHAALDRLIAECGCAPEVLRPDSPIAVLQSVFGPEIGPSQREINTLENAGFLNLCAFQAAEESDFRKLSNFGYITIQKLLYLQGEIQRRIEEQEFIDAAEAASAS